jgi:hypothetical protein
VSFLLLVTVVAAIISLLVSHVLTTRRLDVIHDLVNSNLTRVQSDLVMAQRRIEVLEQHLVDTAR